MGCWLCTRLLLLNALCYSIVVRKAILILLLQDCDRLEKKVTTTHLRVYCVTTTTTVSSSSSPSSQKPRRREGG